MQRSVIGLMVLLLVLLAGGVYYWSQQSVDEPSPAVEEEEMVEFDPLEDATGEGQFLQVVPDEALPLDVTPLASPTTDGESNESISLPVPADAVVVSMTEQGFSPATVSITSGTTVTFVNDGELPHWPASDVHPTHEVLPEFDAKRGLQTGESYSYTFTQVGTWNYHDHLDPRLRGSVTVEGAE